MSGPIFGIEHILSLESSKIESIAYSGILRCWAHWSIVGSDPNEIRVFAALKGGRLYEYFIRAESRNERHNVLNEYIELMYRSDHILLQIQYPQ